MISEIETSSVTTPFWEDDLTRIYHGDCEKIIGSLGSFDLLLTDPPYGIGESGKKNNSRVNAAKPKDYGDFNWDQAPPSDELIALCRGAAKKQIIFGGNYFNLPPTSCWLIWDKQTSGDFADCEIAWTNLKKAIRRITYLWNGMIKAVPEARFHPTQKPFKVMRWCIGHAGGVQSIIDPFCGSGTTLLAARSMGIKCVGIDRELNYCEIARDRIKSVAIDRPLSEVASGHLF